MKIRIVVGIFCFINSLIIPFAVAAGGGYELINGKGIPVCEDYLRNLNSLKDTHNPRAPWRARRPINPKFKDFKDIDNMYGPGKRIRSPLPGDSDAIELDMEKFLWVYDVNPVYYFGSNEWSKWRGTAEQRQGAWERFSSDRERWHFLDAATVDIDNDGIEENILLNNRAGIGGLLLVLNKQLNGIDREKTKLVMQHKTWKEQSLGEFRNYFSGEYIPPSKRAFGRRPVEDFLHGGSYDVFLYKNKVYFDLWWTHHIDYKGKLDIQTGGPLHVYLAENKKTKEMCTMYYRHR